MSLSAIIMFIIAIFFFMGCLDLCLGNKFGLGSSFEKAFALMGPIALAIVGVICISPLIADIISPVVIPIFNWMGVDPAMFAPMIFSTNNGGYSIASKMSHDPEMIRYAGFIVGTLVGPIVTFTIPVGIGLCNKDDQRFFAVGVMAACIAAPFGCFAGGIACGIESIKLLHNLIPVIIISFMLAIFIFFIPQKMITLFRLFAKFITSLFIMGLAFAGFTFLTNIAILPDLDDMKSALLTVGVVVLILGGAFPLTYTIEHVFKKQLIVLSNILGINLTTISGLLISIVTAIPAFPMIHDMNIKGKVISACFAGSMAYMLGPHLGYIFAMDKTMIIPMFVDKIVAGIIAVSLGIFLTKRIFKKELALEKIG